MTAPSEKDGPSPTFDDGCRYHLVKTESASDGHPIHEVVAGADSIVELVKIWQGWQEAYETDERYRIEDSSSDWVLDITKLGRIGRIT
jgi:hypothetical protein